MARPNPVKEHTYLNDFNYHCDVISAYFRGMYWRDCKYVITTLLLQDVESQNEDVCITQHRRCTDHRSLGIDIVCCLLVLLRIALPRTLRLPTMMNGVRDVYQPVLQNICTCLSAGRVAQLIR